MILKFLFPVLAGLSIVLQGTLNRQVSTQIGLASTVFVNGLVFLFFTGGLWFLIRYGFISGGSLFVAKPIETLGWLEILPGIFGCFIVYMTPLAITHLGPNLTFSIIICTQLAVSVVWESIEQKSVPNVATFAGVAVMLLGVFLLLNGRK